MEEALLARAGRAALWASLLSLVGAPVPPASIKATIAAGETLADGPNQLAAATEGMWAPSSAAPPRRATRKAQAGIRGLGPQRATLWRRARARGPAGDVAFNAEGAPR